MVLLNVNHHSACSSPARKWLIFCLISSPCCPYINQDIGKQVRAYKKRYFLIEKPPTCKLDEGTYRLVSEPEGDIKPQVCPFACARVSTHVKSFTLQHIATHWKHKNIQDNMPWLSDQRHQNDFELCLRVSVQDLKFTLAVTKMKGYFEAFFEEPPPFKLSLIEINTEETVWSATIREGTSTFSFTLNMFDDLQVKKKTHLGVTFVWKVRKSFFTHFSLFIGQLTVTENLDLFICKLTKQVFTGVFLEFVC